MVRSPDGGRFSADGDSGALGLGPYKPLWSGLNQPEVCARSFTLYRDSLRRARGVLGVPAVWMVQPRVEVSVLPGCSGSFGQGDDRSLMLLVPTGHHGGESTGSGTWLSSSLHASCRRDFCHWASLLHVGVFSSWMAYPPCHFSCRAVLRAKEGNGWEGTCKLNTPLKREVCSASARPQGD